jgi:F-type H+-transporting ATPase subunit epsilon
MRLKVCLPTEVLVDTEVTKVIAEAENGSFCLLPRHIDFVTALVPGLLSFVRTAGEETFLAVDEGILVKCGADLWVSTRQAVRGPDLGQLRHTVETQFRRLDEREAEARAILAKLEADTVRRFVTLSEDAPS